jgi:hypothetical protein
VVENLRHPKCGIERVSLSFPRVGQLAEAGQRIFPLAALFVRQPGIVGGCPKMSALGMEVDQPIEVARRGRIVLGSESRLTRGEQLFGFSSSRFPVITTGSSTISRLGASFWVVPRKSAQPLLATRARAATICRVLRGREDPIIELTT